MDWKTKLSRCGLSESCSLGSLKPCVAGSVPLGWKRHHLLAIEKCRFHLWFQSLNSGKKKKSLIEEPRKSLKLNFLEIVGAQATKNTLAIFMKSDIVVQGWKLTCFVGIDAELTTPQQTYWGTTKEMDQNSPVTMTRIMITTMIITMTAVAGISFLLLAKRWIAKRASNGNLANCLRFTVTKLSFPLCHPCRAYKNFKRNSKLKSGLSVDHKVSISLERLIQKLDEQLAEEVKGCWIDPNKLILRNFLGHGNNFLLFSGCYSIFSERNSCFHLSLQWIFQETFQ